MSSISDRRRVGAGRFDASRQRLLDALLGADDGARPRALPALDRSVPQPLSFAQERMWFLQELEPGCHYNDRIDIWLRGALEIPLLELALQRIVERHETLRTSYLAREGRPLQRIAAAAPVALPLTSLEDRSAGEREAAALELAFDEARLPFDLTAPPWRARLYRLSSGLHLLALTIHHIAVDGWSKQVFVDELAQLYDALRGGRAPDLPPLPVQYVDHAARQRRRADEGDWEAHLAYWTKQLDGIPAMLQLPLDRPRPGVPSFRGARLPFALPASTTRALRELAQAEQATLFMTLLAGFSALLHRYSGQRDIVVGTPVANRAGVDIERLIGFFVNTLPLRTRPAPDQSFHAAIRGIRAAALDAYTHQELPYERLVEAISPARVRSFNPIFQVMLILQGSDLPAVDAGGVRFEPVDEPNGTAKFDLTLSLAERDGTVTGWFEYATDLFDAATIARMSRHLQRLLAGAAAFPACSLGDLPLLDEDERQTVTEVWSGGGPSCSRPLPVHRLFEQQAALTPGLPALESGASTLTYEQLDRRANALAHRLAAAGVGVNDRVGICLDRSPELAVAVLGVLKAGAAYVPLDPAHPLARVEVVVRDAALAAVVTRSDAWRPFAGIAVPTLAVGEADADMPRPPETAVGAGDLAYVIYTSGSTGRPKGVAMPHAVLANLLAWQLAESSCRAGARTLQFAAPTFDVSFQEMFATWSSGGVLVLVPPDIRRDASRLLRFLEQRRIERMFLPFVALQNLADAATREARVPETLREIVTAGEALRITSPLAALMRRLPECLLQNQYGPTETHVVSSFTLSGPVDSWPALPPIGRPIAGARLYVLDARLQPQPVGVPGELFIGGDVLARGYLSQPELTAERFLPDPFDSAAGARLYRTGDVARWLADGTLEFLGRADDQVKIRGFRVEVGEVEVALAGHEAVRDVAVVCRGEGDDRQLVAYVVPADDRADSAGVLRTHLAERLPEYMVPAVFVTLQTLPLTPTGKVDRRRLPDPPRLRDRVAAAFVPPATPREEVIAGIWSELLHVDGVGVHDSFFELGGHSLLATRLMFRIRDAFDVDVPLRRLFEEPTVAGLAAAIAELAGGAADASRAAPLPQVTPAWSELHEPFSLTDVQQAYWVGRTGSLALGDMSCHMYTELEIVDLDVPRFVRVLRRLIDRHPALRAIVLPDGRQRILEHVPPYDVEILDLAAEPPEAAARQLADLRERMSWQVLPADRWPLFEVRAVRLDDRRHRVHLDFDLLIGDALSMQILVREFLQLYRDERSELPSLGLSFRDYVCAEEALQGSPAWQRARQYWLDRLPSLPPAPELPLARAPESLRGAHFSRRSIRLEGAAWTQLKQRAAGAGLTPSGMLLAAFAEVLTAWSRAPRYALNVTLFNRLPLHPDVNRLVGDFTSVTLLEVDHAAPGSFVARARRLQQQLWTDIDHRAFSGVQVLREMARAAGQPPRAAMPVVFTSTLNIDQMNAETAAVMRRKDLVVHGISQTPQVWLDHQIYEDGSDLVVNWDCVDELFPAGLLDDMFAAYGDLVRRLQTTDEAWRAELRQLLPAAQLEERRLVNDTAGDVPPGLLHAAFFANAARHPDRPAVDAADGSLSYGELAERALAVSRLVQTAGVAPDSLVAIVMEKGWGQVAAALGIVHAGAAYLPVDASLPPARVRQLIEQGGVTLAFTQQRLTPALEWPEGVRAVAVETLDAAAGDVAAGHARPDNLAYVIFTSGSTGVPKGVMIDHRGALNTIVDINDRFAVGAGDRVLGLSSLSFDLSVYDIFGILAAGGALVLPDPAALRDPAHWSRLVDRHAVTIWNSVPALAQIWTEYLSSTGQSAPPSLRLAMLSGDWVPVTLPDRLRALNPGIEVVSLGGATEASIWSILYPIRDVDPAWPSVPYGRPMRNQTFHVLDAALAPRPTWVPGELYIGGIGLARGYWRDPEKTSARFIVHPDTGERLYATGDFGRYLPSGDIEFLGRQDLQVKVQGHRIELAEVEAALADHPSVLACLAAAVGERLGSKQLVAYVVGKPDVELTADDLRRFLAARLPEYMVPVAYVPLAAIPLSANGKVDRSALPAPGDLAADEAGAFVAPRTPVEQAVADIWQKLLGVERVGASDNFFALGGDSLIGTRVVLLIRRAFEIELPVRSIFDHTTPAALSQAIEEMILQQLTATPGETDGAAVHATE